MILTIDVGNTRTKGAVFEGDILLECFVFWKEELQNNLDFILKKYNKTTHIVVASVGNLEKDCFLSFKNRLQIHFVSPNDVFPFVNDYTTPQTLGIDRMVLAAGAVLRYPNQNRLVIDAGTCVTYDFINDKNHYKGGAISPGLRLRYTALNTFTAKLPLLTLENPESFIGNSTATSIHSGVVNGLIYEIEGFITDYNKEFSNFIIILTGGDSEFLAKRLKNTIFANSNFLLESLNQTFQYQTQNE
jgi:type III pantothenate kinase